MRLHTKTTQFILAAFLFLCDICGLRAGPQNANHPKPEPFPCRSNIGPIKNDSHCQCQRIPDRPRIRSVSQVSQS